MYEILPKMILSGQNSQSPPNFNCVMKKYINTTVAISHTVRILLQFNSLRYTCAPCDAYGVIAHFVRPVGRAELAGASLNAHGQPRLLQSRSICAFIGREEKRQSSHVNTCSATVVYPYRRYARWENSRCDVQARYAREPHHDERRRPPSRSEYIDATCMRQIQSVQLLIREVPR